MARPILNIADVELQPRPAAYAASGDAANRFDARMGDVELRYLAVSTRLSPEVCEYPDSGKFAVSIYDESGSSGQPWLFRHVGRPEDARDYWEGE